MRALLVAMTQDPADATPRQRVAVLVLLLVGLLALGLVPE